MLTNYLMRTLYALQDEEEGIFCPYHVVFYLWPRREMRSKSTDLRSSSEGTGKGGELQS
jgi:hypothetical protein